MDLPIAVGEVKVMNEILNADLNEYLKCAEAEFEDLLKTIATIPAPSGHEEKRAEFCKKWLCDIGAEGVYIDDALNVVYPLCSDGCDDIVVFMAHTDIVFPDEKIEFTKDDKYYYAPGVGDDTCSLAVMLMIIRYIVQKGIKPKQGILFVANSCEEGLGNLKGSKQIMSDFEGRVKEFYTFDGKYNAVVNRSVGSHRYEIECRTEGGHSFGAFGNTNAIVELSKLICRLSEIEVPKKENCKTTYNVGLIEGGTSVNTIAQNAKMLYEYRSDDVECLDYMKKTFDGIVEEFKSQTKAEIEVKVVGMRPCGEVKPELRELHAQMLDRVQTICQKHSGMECVATSGSTDANAAMAMGVPAPCPGVYMGGGAHTRGEYVEIASIPVGLKIAAEIILYYFH